MRLLALATLLLVAAISGGAIAAGALSAPAAGDDRTGGGDPTGDLWDILEAVPEDALAFVRLRDGRSLLDAPGGRAAGAALLAALGGEEPAARWRALADRLGWSPEEALRRLVGRDARLFLRSEPDGSTDWAVLTLVERGDVDRIVKLLRPTLVPGGRYDLPADRLTFAYRKGRLLVAADPSSRLFRELSQPKPPAACSPGLARDLEALLPRERRDALLGHRMIAVLPAVGSGLGAGLGAGVDAADGALDGRSLIAVDLADDGRVIATVRSRSASTSPHLARTCRGVGARGVTELVASLAEDALLVMIEPVAADDATDPLVAVGLSMLRPAAPQTPELLRVIAVGECPARECSQPKCTMKRPAIAVAYEVTDAAAARIAQDESVRDACVRLGLDPPRGGCRRVELAPAIERVIGRHPLLVGAELHWRVVERDRCGWQIYATDAAWLECVSARLAALRAPTGDEGDGSPVSSAGRLCGARISEHLRSWIGEARNFAPERPEAFAQGIAIVAEVGSRFRCVEWVVRRDAALGVELTISAQLAPAAGR